MPRGKKRKTAETLEAAEVKLTGSVEQVTEETVAPVEEVVEETVAPVEEVVEETVAPLVLTQEEVIAQANDAVEVKETVEDVSVEVNSIKFNRRFVFIDGEKRSITRKQHNELTKGDYSCIDILKK